jgi:hypothetical protein
MMMLIVGLMQLLSLMNGLVIPIGMKWALNHKLMKEQPEREE